MIKSQGKNIDPHEVEDVVNRLSAVHMGRTVCLGMGNEALVLFEPEKKLGCKEKEQLSFTIKAEVVRRFDIPCHIEAVPERWLEKKPNGTIARRANLDKYLHTRDRRIFVVGDSHVRLLWTEAPSNVQARWLGDFWSREAHRFDDIMLEIFSGLDSNDILIIEAGEPECRVIFPGADNASAAIEKAVSDYEEYFQWILRHWSGKLGYMTGVPTNATVLGPDKHDRLNDWEQPCGTPMLRYACQERFYALMKELCLKQEITFIDACTPFLQEGLYLDEKYLDSRDGVHIDRRYQRRYFDWLDRTFGFVHTAPIDLPAKNITFPLDNRASGL